MTLTGPNCSHRLCSSALGPDPKAVTIPTHLRMPWGRAFPELTLSSQCALSAASGVRTLKRNGNILEPQESILVPLKHNSNLTTSRKTSWV